MYYREEIRFAIAYASFCVEFEVGFTIHAIIAHAIAHFSAHKTTRTCAHAPKKNPTQSHAYLCVAEPRGAIETSDKYKEIHVLLAAVERRKHAKFPTDR